MISVFLQARMSSVRLPGKIIKPICGLPLFLICCRRLMGPNVRLTVLTSTDASDDIVEKMCSYYDIEIHRGSLENVLERFNDQVRELSDDEIVIRATSDNIIPNYEFMKIMVDQFCAAKCEYMTSTSYESGFAYGLSLEVMYANAIKEAYINAATSSEKEHVTPWIKANLESENFTRHDLGWEDTSAQNCTIDTLDQYAHMKSFFECNENLIYGKSLANIRKILKGLEYL